MSRALANWLVSWVGRCARPPRSPPPGSPDRTVSGTLAPPSARTTAPSETRARTSPPSGRSGSRPRPTIRTGVGEVAAAAVRNRRSVPDSPTSARTGSGRAGSARAGAAASGAARSGAGSPRTRIPPSDSVVSAPSARVAATAARMSSPSGAPRIRRSPSVSAAIASRRFASYLLPGGRTTAETWRRGGETSTAPGKARAGREDAVTAGSPGEFAGVRSRAGRPLRAARVEPNCV